VIYFDAKSEADFARFKGKVKGAIVLTGPPREVSARFEPLATRRTDKELLDLADAAEPTPFREMGASTLTLSNTGGTDHQSFDGIGLQGFQFIQDEIHYDTRTHHSNQDVYDHIQADDMKQAAVVLASLVYNTAMRDEKLPRKPEPRGSR